MNGIKYFLLLIFCTNAGWAFAYLNHPIELSNGDRARPDQKEVLIYYANETAPVGEELENYETIIAWLESADMPAASKVVGQLRFDMAECHRVIDREIEEIRTLFQNLQADERKTFVVFTNRLARENRFLILRAGAGEFESQPITLPPGDNYITTNNPFGLEEGFLAALRETAKLFDPVEHVFILLGKSHGNVEMAFTPRLIVRNELESRESILAKLEPPKKNDEPAEVVPAKSFVRIGTTKSAYFRVLNRMGDETGMFFPLVFMESCKSGLGLPERKELPTNIGLIFTTQEEGAKYSCVRWEEVISNEHTIRDGLDRFLRNFAREHGHHEAKEKWLDLRYLYFLPLLLCLGFGVYKMTQRRKIRR